MIENNDNSPPHQQLQGGLPTAAVFWIIWATIFGSLFVYQLFLGKGFPQGEDAAEPLNAFYYGLCFGEILIATFIRWVLIPKVKSISQALVLFIIGIALSEAVVFYEIFLIGPKYPETQMIFFILSALSTFQFIPTYVGKIGSSAKIEGLRV